MSEENPKQIPCQESCSCEDKKSEKKPEEKKPELDPTHFGDWQIDCRAIDF